MTAVPPPYQADRAAAGSDNVPALPPIPPPAPRVDDVVVHLATRRLQAAA